MIGYTCIRCNAEQKKDSGIWVITPDGLAKVCQSCHRAMPAEEKTVRLSVILTQAQKQKIWAVGTTPQKIIEDWLRQH